MEFVKEPIQDTESDLSKNNDKVDEMGDKLSLTNNEKDMLKKLESTKVDFDEMFDDLEDLEAEEFVVELDDMIKKEDKEVQEIGNSIISKLDDSSDLKDSKEQVNSKILGDKSQKQSKEKL